MPYGKYVRSVDPHPRNKEIHHNKVAYTSQHNKDMEYFMGTKVFMFRIEDRKLQCVDHTADSVNNTACQKPSETCPRQIVEDRHESQDTQPAHSNIDYGGKPFRAVDPAAFEDHADDGNSPYQCTEDVTGAAVEDDQAYRCIAALRSSRRSSCDPFFSGGGSPWRWNLQNGKECLPDKAGSW